MKAFCCDECGALVFFENVQCLNCDHPLGFIPEALDLSALEPQGDGSWHALSAAVRGRKYRRCRNHAQLNVCNWLVAAEDWNPLCVSCRLNDVIPNLDEGDHRQHWFTLEQAKRRLIYTLLQLGLPFDTGRGQPRWPLRFRFLSGSPQDHVTTGHANGIITIDIAEADDAERERRRLRLHEPYRTVLGHLRHEVGHYYWEALILNTPRQAAFRALFGDETTDYASSLERHYAQGPPGDWQERHVSEYASSHPWEDWAETWAHYLHIVDTLETASSFGVRLKPRHPRADTMQAKPDVTEAPKGSFDELLSDWMPLTYALNSLNRGMGLRDLYPFVLSGPAIEKLRFIHDTIRNGAVADLPA